MRVVFFKGVAMAIMPTDKDLTLIDIYAKVFYACELLKAS